MSPRPPSTRRPRRLEIHNHQRTRPVDCRHLRVLGVCLMEELLEVPGYELEVSLVGDTTMARMNEDFVHHTGSTDVITFDYTESAPACDGSLAGELFLCVDEALRQARRFRTTWQAEVTRYLIHGVLHLRGYDDLAPAPRRKMKCEEGRLLRRLAGRFPLSRLEQLPRVRA